MAAAPAKVPVGNKAQRKERQRISGASKRKAKREKLENMKRQKQQAEAAQTSAEAKQDQPQAPCDSDSASQSERLSEAQASLTTTAEATPSKEATPQTSQPSTSSAPVFPFTFSAETPTIKPGGSALATARALKESVRQQAATKSQDNTLAGNADFISFTFDASQSDTAAGDAADDDEEGAASNVDSEEDTGHAFAKVAEKLGAFVKGSKDTAANKRKRAAIDEGAANAGTPQGKKARQQAKRLMQQDPYPWLQGVDYSTEQEPARILHREIRDFVKFVEPTEAEHALRSLVVRRVRQVVADKWPTASVHAFGSFETRLYLPTSDIDLVLLSSGEPGDTVYAQPKHLKKLAHLLVKAGIARDIQVIASARVPIIKFVDKLTHIHVDISFNKPTGLVAAGVVKRYCKQMPALRPLVIFIKHFLNMRGMNEVYLGGLGSYAITCLVISFLQRHPKTASGQVRSEENLGVLAVEFLELYGKRFNYDVVGININGPGKYFSKQAVGWQRQGQTYLLSIQDPTDAENDIAKSSFGILKVKGTLAGGHDFLVQRLYDVNDRIKDRRRSSRHPEASGANDSILSAVVSIDQEMKDLREHLHSCYHDQPDVRAMLDQMPADDDDAIAPAPPVAEVVLPSKKETVYVAMDDDEDEDDALIDTDGYKFTKPAGYKEPTAPGDVDDLYAKLNAPETRAPTAPKAPSQPAQASKASQAEDQIYLIESSDDEQVSRPACAPEVIDVDAEEAMDSKVAQVDKTTRARFWQEKGTVLDPAILSEDDE